MLHRSWFDDFTSYAARAIASNFCMGLSAPRCPLTYRLPRTWWRSRGRRREQDDWGILHPGHLARFAPMRFARRRLSENVARSGKLSKLRDGQPVTTAGLVVTSQQPHTAKGWSPSPWKTRRGRRTIVYPAVVRRFKGSSMLRRSCWCSEQSSERMRR